MASAAPPGSRGGLCGALPLLTESFVDLWPTSSTKLHAKHPNAVPGRESTPTPSSAQRHLTPLHRRSSPVPAPRATATPHPSSPAQFGPTRPLRSERAPLRRERTRRRAARDRLRRRRQRELRRRDVEVVAEGPVRDRRARRSARHARRAAAAASRGTRCWTRSIASNFQRWASENARVARAAPPRACAGPRAPRAARARRRCRSTARCGCPRRSSAGSGRRCRRRRRRRPRSPGAAGAGSSCPGSARAGARGRSARRTVGSLTWSRGSKEPTPTRSSSRAGNDHP